MESVYWKTNKDWYRIDEDKGEYILTEKATERATKSFALYSQRRGSDMITANKEPVFWRKNKEWYTYDEDRDEFKMTDKAPERAIKSFELWNRSDEESAKREAV